MTRPTCRKCRRHLVVPATGRPPVYCGTACRRTAEYEVRRCSRRLERLEDEAHKDRVKLAEYTLDLDYHERDIEVTNAQLAAVLAEVKRAESRMRDLLADDEIAP